MIRLKTSLWAAVAVLTLGGATAANAGEPTAGFPGKALSGAVAPGPELTGLDRLLAMEEMKNLRLTFCRALDSHDWDALRSTMAEDFELYFVQTKGPGGPDVWKPIEMTGIENFVAHAKRILTGQSIHICTMPQFEYVTADRARALWFINGYGDIAGQSGLGFERLVEDYVRVNGKWLIKKADARIEANVSFPKN
ncbi:MAG: nuclear transport factor 2 family protein [Sphingobium sp.]